MIKAVVSGLNKTCSLSALTFSVVAGQTAFKNFKICRMLSIAWWGVRSVSRWCFKLDSETVTLRPDQQDSEDIHMMSSGHPGELSGYIVKSTDAEAEAVSG